MIMKSMTFATAVLAVAGVATDRVAFAGSDNEYWVETWSTALHAPDTIVFGTSPGFNNETLRQIIHTSIGGDRVRVRLSTFGAGALVVGAAAIARRDAGARILPASDRMLTFGGQPSITIPPGAIVLSDPVDLDCPRSAIWR